MGQFQSQEKKKNCVGGTAISVFNSQLPPRLLTRLRRMAAKQAKPYQTLIHELLEPAAS